MANEEHLQVVLFLMITALDIVQILILRAKIRTERNRHKCCQKMSAVVRSVIAQTRTPFSHYRLYNLEVKADNGYIYKICSSSFMAAMIIEGSRVDILVPDGAIGNTEEDEYYEQICKRGQEALSTLSQKEKEKLYDYINRKNKTYGDFTNIDYTRIFPSLASDGRGLLGEIIMMSILTAVTSLFIIVRVAVAIKSW